MNGKLYFLSLRALESQRDVVLYPQRLSQAKHHRVMCVMTNRLHSLQAESASANCGNTKSASVLVRIGMG